MTLNLSQPASANGPAWSGATLSDVEDYKVKLTSSHVSEINKALEHFKDAGLSVQDVNKSTFVLPSLGDELARKSKALYDSSAAGFFLVEGLDASLYTAEDNTIIYLGVSAYVADEQGVQDSKGNVLTHITNAKHWTVPESQRHGIHSSKALPFHTDMGCDILALQVRYCAKDGGSTYLSPAKTVFDTLTREEAAVADVLTAQAWPVQTSGSTSRFYTAPAMAIHEHRLMASLDPNRFGRHASLQDTAIPDLTPAQEHALTRVSEVARQHELELKLKTGDLLFFNNWALLHRRDAYVDGAETSRHMVRMWLRDTKRSWNIPQGMLPPWEAAYGTKAPIGKLFAFEPKKEYETPKYSAGSAAFVLED